MVDENGNRTELLFDVMNRITRVTEADPDGNGAGPLTSPVTEFVYDARGNLLSTTDARNHTTQNQYDARDRLVKVIDPDNQEMTYAYDRVGNLTAVVDPLTHRTENRYDARNRLIETIDADGGSTKFAYDADDNLISVIDPVDNNTAFAYDARNRMRMETDPRGKQTIYDYDSANNLVSKTDRNDRLTTYAYDDLDRLTTESWAGGGNIIQYAYDKASNLTSVVDAFSSLALTYDNRNRITTVNNNGTPSAPQVLLTYAYDDVGNVVSMNDTIGGAAGGTNAYGYDALNRTTRLTQSGSAVSDKRVDLTYNQLGQFASIDRYSDLAGTQLVVDSSYGYDSLNRLTSLTHANTGGNVAFYNYVYDDASRITRITDIDGVTDYGYDVRNQLTAADHSPVVTGLPTERPDESYSYDANGNRVSSSLHRRYVTGPGNRLLSDGTFNYSYDDEGNMSRRTEIDTGNYREFEWDFRNRLVSVTDKTAAEVSVQRATFRYDSLGRRISKDVNVTPASAAGAVVTHFVYDGDNVLLDFVDSDGGGPNAAVLKTRYLHGPAVDQVFAQDGGGTDVQWLLTDHLGTVRDLVDDVGLPVNHIVYDSFGSTVSQTNATVVTRYLFTSREFDKDSAFLYFRARYYDASISRFLSEDPAPFGPESANLGSYVRNDPLRRIDPFGLGSVFITFTDGTSIVLNDVTGAALEAALKQYDDKSIASIKFAGHGSPMGLQFGPDDDGSLIFPGDGKPVTFDGSNNKVGELLGPKLADDANVTLGGCFTASRWPDSNIAEQLSRDLPGVSVSGYRGFGFGNEPSNPFDRSQNFRIGEAHYTFGFLRTYRSK